MKQRFFSAYLVIFGMVIQALVLTGCATSVSFQVQRPPTWNTLGIQRVAVMPFTTTDNSGLQRHAATWLTNDSLQRIQGTNHFTLVNSAEIQRVRAANGNIENIVDALFGGQVISVSVNDSSRQSQTTNRDGTTRITTYYTREVRMSYSFNLTRSGRGLDLVGSDVRRDLTRSDTSQDRGSLKSAETLIQELISRNMSGVGRYLAPYGVTERRRLENETSKDKIVKQRAKDAEALVKAGSYRIAQDAFMGIYRDTGSFAAAYNAGLLIEVLGDLQGAYAFMQRILNETGNPKAAAEISRLQRVIDDAGLLAAYADNQSQRDMVIARMVDTLPSRMPRSPRIALINNSQNERDLTEIVINGILQGFLSKNITVVDRSNRALVEMERNYQLAGNVSDAEMTRIGNEAGVNTFVLISVVGSGAARHLSVRMLDVERNTILYQSTQSDGMNL